jgi:hypothetical protein
MVQVHSDLPFQVSAPFSTSNFLPLFRFLRLSLRFAFKKSNLLTCSGNRLSDALRVTADVHCRGTLTEATKDHVFPSSWYPDTTPDEVQRWTAPSCERCNAYFGRLETDLLVFLAYCINPQKAPAQRLYERVRRMMGIGVEGLSDEEKGHREARRRKLLSRAHPYSPEVQPHIIPGLGPHPGATGEFATANHAPQGIADVHSEPSFLLRGGCGTRVLDEKLCSIRADSTADGPR